MQWYLWYLAKDTESLQRCLELAPSSPMSFPKDPMSAGHCNALDPQQARTLAPSLPIPPVAVIPNIPCRSLQRWIATVPLARVLAPSTNVIPCMIRCCAAGSWQGPWQHQKFPQSISIYRLLQCGARSWQHHCQCHLYAVAMLYTLSESLGDIIANVIPRLLQAKPSSKGFSAMIANFAMIQCKFHSPQDSVSAGATIASFIPLKV